MQNWSSETQSSMHAPEFHIPIKNQITKGNIFLPFVLLFKHIDLRMGSNESHSFQKQKSNIIKPWGCHAEKTVCSLRGFDI